MMAAAASLGRQEAHDVVYDACRRAIEGCRALADELADMPQIVAALGADGIRFWPDPIGWSGFNLSS